MTSTQIKSKHRVANHGEVFTNESFEKALVMMCKTKQDLELVKEVLKPLELRSKQHYEGLYAELEEQIK